jgi:4-amino-4-deoxy-L-arabinose transferase-like glycosyltransferase
VRKYVVPVLAALFCITLVLRLGSYKVAHYLTNDEYVYPALANGIGKVPAEYDTMHLYQAVVRGGQTLPAYFNKPLFKHPYAFPYFIMRSFLAFGQSGYAAFFVALFFGILLIPLAYLMGATLFDEATGLYAAVLMAIEPVAWICSQKIWPATTLAFFGTLSLYCFARAIKDYKPYWMAVSGIAAGLALLTKYSGLLFVLAIAAYALASERWLFRKKGFIVGLCIPLLLFLPWVYWNYRVYGPDFIIEMTSAHNLAYRLSWRHLAIAAVFAIGAVAVRMLSQKRVLRDAAILGTLLALLFILRANILHAFDFTSYPRAGWKIGMFANEPWYFYPAQLIELSPFYLFSLLGIGLPVFDRERVKSYSFLYVIALIFIGLCTVWGEYQSRYVVPVAVLLVVAGARVQVILAERIRGIRANPVKIGCWVLSAAFVIACIARTMLIISILAVFGTVCYF